MIRREDVADLREGDVVEVRHPDWKGGCIRGPLYKDNGLAVGGYILIRYDGDLSGYLDVGTLTVVSRAPRPLYTNSDRTEPVPGDVVRDADDVLWLRDSWKTWHSPESTCGEEHQETGLAQPLHLLVDGSTGEVVP